MFTQEELKTIVTLINRVQITGNEAFPVALLQQKLASLLTPPQVKEEVKSE